MKSSTNSSFVVIGAGLAGSEAALTLANLGWKVRLYEQKPKNFSAAHRLQGPAELVCSNSLKSRELTSAHGLLKEELRRLQSPLLALAEESAVPGGKALVVDREVFSQKVEAQIVSHPLIELIREEVKEPPFEEAEAVLIATGPLTSDSLSDWLKSFLDESGLFFYDATSPVVDIESLDLSHFFWGNRNQDGDDYLNLPLNQEQYDRFRNEVLAAEKVEGHLPEEQMIFFEGCLPIEVLASRGAQTLQCSCMSPDGFPNKAPAGTVAIIQFRREKASGQLFNMVGFQTRMKWPEQERVFRALPGMERAEFARLGAMHRNTFINTPRHLNDRLQHKKEARLFFAGQITGGEGYTEALATGHYAALSMAQLPLLPEETAIRSLVRFIVQSDEKHFQPMNFNFGLLPPLTEKIRAKRSERKKSRNAARSERSLMALEGWLAKWMTPPEPKSLGPASS